MVKNLPQDHRQEVAELGLEPRSQAWEPLTLTRCYVEQWITGLRAKWPPAIPHPFLPKAQMSALGLGKVTKVESNR